MHKVIVLFVIANEIIMVFHPDKRVGAEFEFSFINCYFAAVIYLTGTVFKGYLFARFYCLTQGIDAEIDFFVIALVFIFNIPIN